MLRTVYNGTESLTFLGPRIWEIVSGHIKKSNSFEEFKLKIKLWNPENCPCRLCKRFLPQVCFFTLSDKKMSVKIFITHEKFRHFYPTKILSSVEISNSCFFCHFFIRRAKTKEKKNRFT